MQVSRISLGLSRRILLSFVLATGATAAITTTTATADTIDLLQENMVTALPVAAFEAQSEAQPEAQPAIPLAAPPAAPPASVAGSAVAQVLQFGVALDGTLLEQQRGGSDLGTPVPVSSILSNGVVGDNRATDVVTGSNVIRDGAFTSASGIPVVIQNTGANVLIQNSTIVNLQLH